MSWVTVIWSMVASACITLAAIHLLIWWQRRAAWANLFVSLTALAVAAFAGCEVWMMRAESPAEFATALRLAHVPTWVIVVSLIGFVRLHLRAGRPSLAWAIFGLRSVALPLNFLVGQNLNFLEVTRLRHVPFLGETVSIAEGVSNPLMLVGQLSLLLLVIFAADAGLTVWRRGDRQQALLTGGGIVLFALGAVAQSVLVLWQIVDLPLTATLFYLGIVAAMGYELSRNVLRAAQLARDLRESEHHLTLAAAAANLGIWTRDLVRDEIWASDQWRALFGFGKTEPLEVSLILNRIHPDDREAVAQVLPKATANGGGYEMQYRIVLPDGGHRWIASRGRAELDATGTPVRVRAVSLDITALKRAEAEVLQQRAELAHLSRVVMLGELSGSLAHELNQPLTAILSNAQAAQRFLAHDDADLDEVKAILADIVAEAKRAGEVIRRLRLLLKKGEVQHQPFDLNEMVQEVLKLVRSDLVNQGVTAETELAPASPGVNGDRVQLQQVLLNLVMNACDVMAGDPAQGRKLIIRTALDGDDRVRVSVADRGIGLPPDNLEKVFEPFFTTKVHGMGLGLSVCRTIVTAHGGKIWAASNSERGATFHFTLPFCAEANP